MVLVRASIVPPAAWRSRRNYFPSSDKLQRSSTGGERWVGTRINSQVQGRATMTWESAQNHLVVLFFIKELRPEQSWRGLWNFREVSP